MRITARRENATTSSPSRATTSESSAVSGKVIDGFRTHIARSSSRSQTRALSVPPAATTVEPDGSNGPRQTTLLDVTVW